MSTAKMPVVNPKAIPVEVGRKIFCATLEAIRNVQKNSPDVWARIEARAAEHRAEGFLQN